MQIAHQKVVSIHYTLTNVDGDIIDSSEGSEPLSYLHGFGNIIPGLENALTGRKAGDRLTVSVTPAEGYGERDDGMIQTVPRNAFQGVDEIQPGMQFQAQSPEGMQLVTVIGVEEDQVILDGNHPMAGLDSQLRRRNHRCSGRHS
jgi:FKBP-type peptidyl-prolyl cis-trans isomerase SlyD